MTTEVWELSAISEYRRELCDYYRRQALSIFNARNRLDDSLVLDKKPKASTQYFAGVLARVRAALNGGAGSSGDSGRVSTTKPLV